MKKISDIMDELRKWWIWAHIGTGKPRGCASCLGDYESAITPIPEDDALAIDKIVAGLKRIDASAHDALVAYLETESFREVARRLRCDRITAQKLIERALGWVSGCFVGGIWVK